MKALQYSYASEKFLNAVYSLVIGKGDVRSRLLSSWEGSLSDLTSEDLPEKLRKDFLWVTKQLHRYSESWTGELMDLQEKEKDDPTFKEKFAYLYPKPVEATLRRINNKTGSKIASRIFAIYDSLESIIHDG